MVLVFVVCFGKHQHRYGLKRCTIQIKVQIMLSSSYLFVHLFVSVAPSMQTAERCPAMTTEYASRPSCHIKRP